MPVTVDKLLGKPLLHTHQATDIIGIITSGDNTTTITVTSNTVLSDVGTVLVDATAGAITIGLPAVASSTNKLYRIKKIDSSANEVIVDGNGSERIDGNTTITIAFQYSAMDIVCNGSGWYIV